MDNLADFPKEILEHIVSYMGSNEQLNMRLANTKWFKLVNYRNFTVRFASEKILPHIVDRLLQYNEPIGLKFVKSKFKKIHVYAAQLSRLTNLTSLAVPYFHEDNKQPEAWWGFTTLTNLQEWEVPHGCPASVTASLINMRYLSIYNNLESIKKMSNLEHLKCNPNANASLDVFSPLPCPARLTHLETNGNLDYTNASKIYNLRELDYIADEDDEPLQLSLDKFSALNCLRIEQPHVSFSALPTTLTSLTISGESIDVTSLQYLARLHGLNEFNLQPRSLSDEQYVWISHLTSLSHLSIWSIPEADMEPFTGAMYGIIKSSTLKKLEINVSSHMDLGHLSCLTALEDLYIDESDNAEVHTDYSFMSHLTRLKRFVLHPAADRPSLTALANLEKLENLRIRGQIPMLLERLTSLENLMFDSCEANVFESFSALTHLTSLHVISLPDINCEFLTTMPLWSLGISEVHESFYTVLVQLTGLRELNVQGLTADQVIGLSALQHLTWLNAADCDVGEGKHVTHLTTLHVLYVKGPLKYSSLIEPSLPNLVDWSIIW